VIFVDYRPKNPDFKAYSAFLKALRQSFSANPRLLVAVADAFWLEEKHKAGLRLVAEGAAFFLIELPKPELSPEILKKLSGFAHPFRLRLPAGMEFSNGDKLALKKIRTFSGVALTLDPKAPLPQKEKKIGVFPKL
jgi:hypothetical protein